MTTRTVRQYLSMHEVPLVSGIYRTRSSMSSATTTCTELKTHKISADNTGYSEVSKAVVTSH